MGEKIHQKSVWAVWLFIGLVSLIFPLQLFVSFNLPLRESAYALMMVVGAYLGFDQLATFTKTKTLKPGDKFTGSYKKLLHITIAMFCLLLELIILQFLCVEIEMPLGEMILCVGAVAGIFVGGNKANNMAEATNGG